MSFTYRDREYVITPLAQDRYRVREPGVQAEGIAYAAPLPTGGVAVRMEGWTGSISYDALGAVAAYHRAQRGEPATDACPLKVYLVSPTGRGFIDDFPAADYALALDRAHALVEQVRRAHPTFRVEIIDARDGRTMYEYSQIGSL